MPISSSPPSAVDPGLLITVALGRYIELLRKHALRIEAFFAYASEHTLDETQRAMLDARLVHSARVLTNKADGKIVVSAGLLAAHGQSMQPGNDCAELMQKAALFTRSFQKTHSMARFAAFKAAFRAWQELDKHALLQQLVSDYRAWSAISENIKDKDTEGHEEWRPHIETHQGRIRAMVARIGGTAALTQLSEGGALPENLRIVHEMVLDPKYSASRIIASGSGSFSDSLHKSMQIVKEQPELVGDVAMALVNDIRSQLQALDPSGAMAKQIAECIDLDVLGQALRHRTSVHGKLIEIQHQMTAVLGLMAMMCAPVRDAEIQEIQMERLSLETFEGLVGRLFAVLHSMRLDVANYGLASLKPVLLRHAIEYEQRAWATIPKTRTRAWLERHRLDTVNATWSLGVSQLLFNQDDGEWPETLQLDQTRLKSAGKELQDDCRLQAIRKVQPAFSKCRSLDEIAGDVKRRIDADPVYKLLQKRSAEDMRQLFQGATSNSATINTASDIKKQMVAFAKYHWQIHAKTYSDMLFKK